MNAKIYKSIALGSIVAPPSKSYAHRYMIASFLAGEGEIENISFSNDINATIDSLKALGANIDIEGNIVKINRSDNYGKFCDAKESGSTLRFIIPLILYVKGKGVIKGSKKLFSRGLSVYEDIFKKQNIKYELKEDTLSIEGRLYPDHFMIPGNISSQFITGMLFVLPLLEEDSEIEIVGDIESKSYIDITIDVLKQFNVKVEMKDNIIYIPGRQKFISKKVKVEGDYSNSAFFEVLNYLGGEVKISNLNPLTKQGDKAYLEYFPLLKESHPEIDIKNCIDLGPILFAFASIFNGAVFKNIKRLRIKESDRVGDTLAILEHFGVTYICRDNELEIFKSELHVPSEPIDTFNDHRIVMMTSILLTKFGGVVKDIEAVNKSYPNFFNDLEEVGVEVKYER